MNTIQFFFKILAVFIVASHVNAIDQNSFSNQPQNWPMQQPVTPVPQNSPAMPNYSGQQGIPQQRYPQPGGQQYAPPNTPQQYYPQQNTQSYPPPKGYPQQQPYRQPPVQQAYPQQGIPQQNYQSIPNQQSKIPGVDLSGLNPQQVNQLTSTLQAEPCSCGCNYDMLGCRIYDSSCPVSLGRAQQLVSGIRSRGSMGAPAGFPKQPGYAR